MCVCVYVFLPYFPDCVLHVAQITHDVIPFLNFSDTHGRTPRSLIGAGKTTLATALAKELGLPVYYEPVVDNVYLADFYQDMQKYSFPMQIYLLNKRFKQQQEIIWTGRGGVQDRTIYEDSVFASMLYSSGHMDQRDYQTYRELFSAMSNFMRRPNLIVHLDLTPEESLRRINERNRGCESGIGIEYLSALHAAYERFLSEISRIIPVIKVDYSRFRTAEEMAAAIKQEYRELTMVRHVSWPVSPQRKKKGGTTNAEKRGGVDTGKQQGEGQMAPQMEQMDLDMMVGQKA